MKKLTLAFGFVLLAASLPSLVSAARAGVATLTVTPQPAEVTLIPGLSARGHLVVANDGKAKEVVIVTASPLDETIAVTPHRLERAVEAGVSKTFGFTITRRAEGVTPSTSVPFIVSYHPTAGPTKTRTQQFVVTSLVAKDAPTPALVEARIAPDIGTINEHSPGESQLQITNLRETPVYIREFIVRSPRGVKTIFTCPYPKNGDAPTTTVQPGTMQAITNCPNFQIQRLGEQAVPLVFSTEDAVVPGERTAFVKFTASLHKQGAARPAKNKLVYYELPRSVVAPTTFKVEVFGESAILNALGVPIFLLVPGAIIVVMLLFLVSTVGPWRKKVKDAIGAEGKLNVRTAESTVAIAILSVGASLAMALAYPSLTDALWPGYARNYLHAYGFNDFYYVFSYSFVVIAVIWAALGLARLGTWLYRRKHPHADKNATGRPWRFEVYKDHGGEERWRLKAANGETVASSGQSFASHAAAHRQALKVKDRAASATVVDVKD